MRWIGRVGPAGHAGTRSRRLPSRVRHNACTMSEQPAAPDAPTRTWWQMFRSAPRGVRWSAYAVVGAGRAAGAPARRRRRASCCARSRRPTARSRSPGLAAEVEVVRDDARHPAGLRRHRRRPAARPGLRARPGALLRDGRAPPRHRPAGSPSCSARTASRPTRSSAPWAGAGSPSRSWRSSTPRPARRSRRTPRGSTPTSRRTAPPRSPSSTPLLGRDRARLRARAVDARRLAGLAQGDGVGPARQHDRRGRPGGGQPRPHARARSPQLYPDYPFDAAPADRRQRRRRRRRLRAERHRQRDPQPAPPGVLAPRWSTPSSGVRDAVAADPRPDGPRRRHRLQLAGSSTASTARPARRCWPTTRTSASACPASGCRWACTAATVTADCTLDSSGFTFSGVPGVIIGHNADIAWGFTNLGPDVTDLYLEKIEGDDAGSRTARRRPLAAAHRDDQGRAARTTSSCRSARPRTARWSATCRRSSARSAPTRRPTSRTRPVAATATPSRWRGPRSSPAPPPTPSSPSTGPATGTSSGRPPPTSPSRAEPRLRRPRGPHRLPGARADPDPQVRQRRPDARRGLGLGQRLDRRLRPLRRAAERARPRGGVRRHRQPGRGRRRTTPTSSPTTGTAATARPGSARCSRRRASSPSTRWPASSSTPPTRWPRPWCPTCSTSRTCPATTTATASGCWPTGTSPSPPTAPRRPTTTWCGATCCG